MCATNDGAKVDSSGYGEIYANNACILAASTSTINPYKYGNCAVDKKNGKIIAGTLDISYNNSFFVRSNVTLAVKCGKSFALEEFQRNGYDVGSTVRVIPSEKTLLTWARALLYPIEPTNPSDDPRDLPWKM